VEIVDPSIYSWGGSMLEIIIIIITIIISLLMTQRDACLLYIGAFGGHRLYHSCILGTLAHVPRHNSYQDV